MGISVALSPTLLLSETFQFTILADHDHDTWTDTYSDPTFYDWLLQHLRP